MHVFIRVLSLVFGRVHPPVNKPLRRVFHCVFLCACLALLSLAGWAQAASNPEPHAVLNGCAAAMGASQAELPIVAQGALTVPGSQESKAITVKTHGARLFRQDQASAGGLETFVVKDGTGSHRNGAQKEKVAAHATRYFRPEHLPALACAPDLNKFDVTYEGAELVQGRSAHHLKLLAKPANTQGKGVEAVLSEFHVYVDQQTFLVLKTSTFVFSPDNLQNRSTWETYYSDYRNLGGLLVPFHFENYLSGQKVRDVVFTDIQVGVALSDTEFE